MTDNTTVGGPPVVTPGTPTPPATNTPDSSGINSTIRTQVARLDELFDQSPSQDIDWGVDVDTPLVDKIIEDFFLNSAFLWPQQH